MMIRAFFRQLFLICTFLIFTVTYHCKLSGQTVFTPDTTINSSLTLRNTAFSSLYSNFDTHAIVCDEESFYFKEEQPFVLFLNASRTEYLIAIIHEGTWDFYFAEFEVGKISDSILLQISIPYIVTSYQNFQTESSIYIGMSVETLEQIKGVDYVQINNNIRYCYNSLDSEFIEYGGCEYYLEIEIIDNKILDSDLDILHCRSIYCPKLK